MARAGAMLQTRSMGINKGTRHLLMRGTTRSLLIRAWSRALGARTAWVSSRLPRAPTDESDGLRHLIARLPKTTLPQIAGQDPETVGHVAPKYTGTLMRGRASP